MPIKDANYWKEYNQKRKEYIQQKNKERYNKDKGCINTTKPDATFNTTDATDATKNNTTTDATEKVVLKKDTTTILTTDTTKPVLLKTDTTENNTTLQPELIKPILQPCQNCLQLKKENDRLQWEVDDCDKRHQIPKDANFIDLMWDRHYKKFIFYSCADSCWNGKYCNNCSALEEKLINRIKEKTFNE